MERELANDRWAAPAEALSGRQPPQAVAAFVTSGPAQFLQPPLLAMADRHCVAMVTCRPVNREEPAIAPVVGGPLTTVSGASAACRTAGYRGRSRLAPSGPRRCFTPSE